MKSVATLVPCVNKDELFKPTFRALKGVLESLEGYSWRILSGDKVSRETKFGHLMAIAREDDRVRIRSCSRKYGHMAATPARQD